MSYWTNKASVGVHTPPSAPEQGTQPVCPVAVHGTNPPASGVLPESTADVPESGETVASTDASALDPPLELLLDPLLELALDPELDPLPDPELDPLLELALDPELDPLLELAPDPLPDPELELALEPVLDPELEPELPLDPELELALAPELPLPDSGVSPPSIAELPDSIAELSEGDVWSATAESAEVLSTTSSDASWPPGTAELSPTSSPHP